MKKAFTLIEVFVVIAILAISGLIIANVVFVSNGGTIQPIDNTTLAYFNPRAAQAIALQQQANANAELAKQMAEQNRLLREQIEKNSK